MPKLSRLTLREQHHLLRLKAKLQSVEWDGVPEEVQALVSNIAELVTPKAIGHGGYFNRLTRLMVDNSEFIRFVLGKKNNPSHIPTIEAFINDEGFVHFHIILTFVGERDEEVDKYVSEQLVEYLCGAFMEPSLETSIVIHQRWKKAPGDRTAPYTEALWGEEAAIKVNKILIIAQQEVAKKEQQELRAAREHAAQVAIAGEVNPRKDINE